MMCLSWWTIAGYGLLLGWCLLGWGVTLWRWRQTLARCRRLAEAAWRRAPP